MKEMKFIGGRGCVVDENEFITLLRFSISFVMRHE